MIEHFLMEHPSPEWEHDGDRTYLILNDDGSVTHERRQPPLHDCGHRSWSWPFVANADYPPDVPRYEVCRRCENVAKYIYGPWSKPSNESGSEGGGSRTGYPRIAARGDAPYHPHDYGVRRRDDAGVPE